MKTTMYKFQEIGSFIGLEGGVLISAPIWKDGTFDEEEICQVEELPKEIVPAIKRVLQGEWEKNIYTY
jgi:hypothetical protein